MDGHFDIFDILLKPPQPFTGLFFHSKTRDILEINPAIPAQKRKWIHAYRVVYYISCESDSILTQMDRNIPIFLL